MSYLGRGFLDPSKMDANNHWQRTYNGRDVTVVSDYTVTANGEGKPVTIVQKGKIVSRAQTVGPTTLEAKVVYDPAMGISGRRPWICSS